MVQRIRPRVHRGLQRVPVPVEVRYQQLYLASRNPPAYLPDALREYERPPVRQIVAVHRRYHHVPQPHPLHRLREPDGFLQVQPLRNSGRDRAVRAGPRAYIPQDHERRCPSLPALPDIRTARLLADRMQLLLPELLPKLYIVRPAGHSHFEPLRKTAPRSHVSPPLCSSPLDDTRFPPIILSPNPRHSPQSGAIQPPNFHCPPSLR